MLRRQANVRPVPRARKSASTRSRDVPRPRQSEAFGAVLSERPKHNGAAFMAYRGSQQGSVRGTSMRLIVGIIIGCALTVGGAYVADTMAATGAKPVMVNWDVVAKNMDSVTTLARAGWKKIAGRAD
jgi:hypothetical protein